MAVIAAIICFACKNKAEANESQTTASHNAVSETKATEAAGEKIAKDGFYYDVKSVVSYLDTYGKLPDNFITKNEAKKLGWEGGSVEKVAPDKAIGGDYFGNYEKQLPQAPGIEYHECDIDTHGYKDRGSRRLIFSNDGHYYYTKDHYGSFEEVFPK